MRSARTTLAIAAVASAVAGIGVTGVARANDHHRQASVEVFAPKSGDVAGVGGRGWFVDMAVNFDNSTLAGTGASLQLTGPGVHANAAPFPGTFSPGRDDRMPGVVVLVSGTKIGAGQGQNVANLFNLTGVTDRSSDGVEIWDTWIVGAPSFGSGPSTLLVAVVDDLNGNGILDDAPNVVADSDGDGIVNADDLKALGLASDVEQVDFEINSAP
jgi:hypothetical protein